MLWQVAAAACIGSLFYVRRVAMWARHRVDFRSPRAMGYVFATVYGLVVSPLVCSLCRSGHVPRFGDLFLLGIVLSAYFFTWEAAAYLLGVAVLVSAWVLPPDGSFAVAARTDLYRIVSFALVSVFLICLITRVKAGHVASLVRHAQGAGMDDRAVGAD
jgi:K+-sensing histidine kinase KdpD